MSEPEELILRPRKGKAVLVFVVCAGFVGMGMFIIAKEGNWFAWMTTGFFGLCLSISLIEIFSDRSYLRLTPEGFTIHGHLRSTTYRWDEVAGFGVEAIGSEFNKMVVLDFSDNSQVSPVGRSVARALAGCEGALPDTYGMKPADLAALMNAWRLRALIGKLSDGAKGESQQSG